jgi:membrane fusion protein (multidrug efflux system)
MRYLSAIFILGYVLAACGNPAARNASTNPSGTNSPQPMNVAAVESLKLDTTLSLPAQITPYEVVDIYPKITGFLDTINVDRGSHVRAGELMIRLSAPEIVAQRAQAEAALQSAQAQLGAAQAKFAADQGTYLHLAAAAQTPGVVAGNDLQIADQTAAADKAQVESAAKNVQAAQNALRGVAQLESYLEIRAPFDGIVTLRNLHPGALVGPASGQAGSQPIVQVENLSRLRVVVPVPEAYVAGVEERHQTSFSVPAYPGRSFQAPIVRISHDIEQSTRTMQVELDFHNAGAEITPGTFANVEWPIRRTYPTLFVPSAAITTDLQRTFVIRVRQGKAEWVDVKSGVSVNGKTEVFGNLTAGEVIIANATDSIRPGTAVEGQEKKY